MRTFGLPFANGKTLRKATFLLWLFYRSGLVEPVVLEGSGPRWGHFIVSNDTRKAPKTAGLSSLGVAGVPWHPQILADHLTLSQPGGTDNAHHITTGTPGFSDLPTALRSYLVLICLVNLKALSSSWKKCNIVGGWYKAPNCINLYLYYNS